MIRIRSTSAARAARGSAAVLAALSAVCLAAEAAAQEPTQQFSIVTRTGAIRFDRAASLETAPFLGVDASYGLNRNFAIGTVINVSRPNTRAEDFVTTITFGIPTTGDTTLFLETGQAVSLVEGGLAAEARLPMGRFTPFVVVGGGYYGMFFDPQINRGSRRMTGWTGSGGGGVRVQLSPRAGLQFDARDVIFTNYRASRLDPADGRNPNVFFPEDFPPPPQRKETVHNIMFSIGFRYVPGLRTEEAEGEGIR